MSAEGIVGIGLVFATALIFTLLLISRKTIFGSVYGALATISWFALGAVHLSVFSGSPEFIPIAYLWFALGVFTILLTVVLALMLLSSGASDFEVEAD
jgi:hypothetical protein